MIARAALNKPWLFRQAAAALRGEPIPPEPTLAEERELMLHHYRLVCDRFGVNKGTVLMRIREAKEHGDAVVACPQEPIDRDTAENLKGSRIFIPRSSFPSTQTDEYYWVDLIGLGVQNRDAQPLGVVTDLMPTGPHAVLVIQAPNPAEPTQPLERLIPFVNAYVDKVDLEARTVWVDWPLDHD